MENKDKGMLEALYNAIIIKVIENEAQTGNIIVPDIGNAKNKIGEVVSVGPGAFSQNGVLIPTQLKVGMKVLLPTMGFSTFDFEGETYHVGREQEVLSKIIKK